MSNSSRPPDSEPLFADLFELEHFFELLDNWADAPEEAVLDSLYHDDAYIRRRVQGLCDLVAIVELAHGMQKGSSYQAEVLIELDIILAELRSPADLAANLDKLKMQLYRAHFIGEEMRIDAREPAARRERKRIASLERENQYTHGDRATKQKQYAREIERLLEDNPRLSVTEAKRRTAHTFGVSYKTVDRYTDKADDIKKS